jgi:hypothetical protein
MMVAVVNMPAGTLVRRGGKRAADDRGEPAGDVKHERSGEYRPGVRDRQAEDITGEHRASPHLRARDPGGFCRGASRWPGGG